VVDNHGVAADPECEASFQLRELDAIPAYLGAIRIRCADGRIFRIGNPDHQLVVDDSRVLPGEVDGAAIGSEQRYVLEHRSISKECEGVAVRCAAQIDYATADLNLGCVRNAYH